MFPFFQIKPNLKVTIVLFIKERGDFRNRVSVFIFKIPKILISESLDSLIAPKLIGIQLSAKFYTYTQQGSIVCIIDSSAKLNDQTINVNSSGYYYFDGCVRRKMMTNPRNDSWLLANTSLSSKINQTVVVPSDYT